MPRADPHWTLADYMEVALQLYGSPFTVGREEEASCSKPPTAPCSKVTPLHTFPINTFLGAGGGSLSPSSGGRFPDAICGSDHGGDISPYTGIYGGNPRPQPKPMPATVNEPVPMPATVNEPVPMPVASTVPEPMPVASTVPVTMLPAVRKRRRRKRTPSPQSLPVLTTTEVVPRSPPVLTTTEVIHLSLPVLTTAEVDPQSLPVLSTTGVSSQSSMALSPEPSMALSSEPSSASSLEPLTTPPSMEFILSGIIFR
ncbi:selenoprotein V-like [Myxocyprinus asiaticus]|uniref:selenoprotein V-like n=1 Tax=Myxocyprinus asiaticus TaxID=70543 RepID=UPI00222322A9|nr:selenoprotein V-like [Myxocyprinus asiaticus]